MIELRYFTGTGNSKRVLQICKQILAPGNGTIRMASLTQAAPLDPRAGMIGFCFPVYSLGAPRVVRRYLRQLPVQPVPVKAFVLATIGGRDEEGWALREGRDLLAKKGFHVVYADAVLMPDNWVPMAHVPDAEEAHRMLTEGEKHAAAIAQAIRAGQEYFKPFVMPKFGPIGSRIMHFLFHRRGVYQLWKFFKTTEACSGCGLCARICPMHAIRIETKKPRWSVACEQCMRCVNFCPEEAIQQLESIGHGSSRPRYHEPHFNPSQEG